MRYNFKKIDEDTIQHQMINEKTGKIIDLGEEPGISKIKNLKAHLQSWVTHRRDVFKIKSVTNDFGFKLR